MTSLYLLLERDANPGPFTSARSGVASALMMFFLGEGRALLSEAVSLRSTAALALTNINVRIRLSS